MLSAASEVLQMSTESSTHSWVMHARGMRVFASVLGFSLAALSTRSAEAILPAGLPSQPVIDPGRSAASGDDTTAIAQNPANLAFLPGAELRWTSVWTPDSAGLPLRGHSFGAGFSAFGLASGLRLDFFLPPDGARDGFRDWSYWVRFPLSLRLGEGFALGTTFGWGRSDEPSLDAFFSVASGFTWRPNSYLSVALVARDWNRPVSRMGTTIQRTYDAGFAVRPLLGYRDLELGVQTTYYEDDGELVPKATLGVDLPYIGRLRGDVALRDLGASPHVLATVGLDINFGPLQVSGGALVGDALTPANGGFFVGAAVRGFKEKGIPSPSKVVKIRIDSTPGARGQVRLLRHLWELANNPSVAGIVLVLRAEPSRSLAHAEELGDAIRGLRLRGKRVICHLEDAGGRSLHACSQANKIAMNPAGGLRFAGISSQYYFFGSLLKKLGVKSEFVRIGDHKLAAEQYTRSESSPIGREDHQALVDEFERLYLHDVGGGRRIAVGELKKRIASGPFVASEALKAGLIDLLAYDDEIDSVVEETFGQRMRIVDDTPSLKAPARWTSDKKIALVYLSGDMLDGESQSVPLLGVNVAGSYTIARALKKARDDASVRAVVFRIESPGGSSLAADVILREAILTAKKKPLIVSMGSTAASGGYYAAVAGSKIFANRATITGSIGIFYGKVDVSGLLGKLGVNIEGYRSAPRADAESLFRPFTDDEKRELGVKVKQFYDLFVARVSEGRHMEPADVDAVARGKVWTGAQALERKLVDQIGGLRHALAEARKLGDLPADTPIIELPEDDDSLLGTLLNLAGIAQVSSQSMAPFMIPPVFADMARALAPFMLFDTAKPMARSEFAEHLRFGGSSGAREEP